MTGEIVATVTYDDTLTAVSYDNTTTVSTVGIQGLSAADAGLTQLGDVDASNLVNGSVLVYKTTTNKWTSTLTLDAQNMEGGEF